MTIDSEVVGESAELALALWGLALIWLKIVRPAARPAWPPLRLAAWDGTFADFLLYLFAAFAGGIAVPALAQLPLRHSGLSANSQLVLLSLGLDAGFLVGIGVYRALKPPPRPPAGSAPPRPLRDGAFTFLIVVPIVLVVTPAWQALLRLFGFEIERQDVIQLFEHIDAGWLRVLFVLFAVVFAPWAEELIFRAGIFRFLSGRIPRPWPMVISAVLFGAAHLLGSAREGFGVFLPLVVLGMILAVAYERTGSIRTTIIAHSLFNLNTILLMLLGVDS